MRIDHALVAAVECRHIGCCMPLHIAQVWAISHPLARLHLAGEQRLASGVAGCFQHKEVCFVGGMIEGVVLAWYEGLVLERYQVGKSSPLCIV